MFTLNKLDLKTNTTPKITFEFNTLFIQENTTENRCLSLNFRAFHSALVQLKNRYFPLNIKQL